MHHALCVLHPTVLIMMAPHGWLPACGICGICCTEWSAGTETTTLAAQTACGRWCPVSTLPGPSHRKSPSDHVSFTLPYLVGPGWLI